MEQRTGSITAPKLCTNLIPTWPDTNPNPIEHFCSSYFKAITAIIELHDSRLKHKSTHHRWIEYLNSIWHDHMICNRTHKSKEYFYRSIQVSNWQYTHLQVKRNNRRTETIMKIIKVLGTTINLGGMTQVTRGMLTNMK